MFFFGILLIICFSKEMVYEHVLLITLDHGAALLSEGVDLKRDFIVSKNFG